MDAKYVKTITGTGADVKSRQKDADARAKKWIADAPDGVIRVMARTQPHNGTTALGEVVESTITDDELRTHARKNIVIHVQGIARVGAGWRTESAGAANTRLVAAMADTAGVSVAAFMAMTSEERAAAYAAGIAARAKSVPATADDITVIADVAAAERPKNKRSKNKK